MMGIVYIASTTKDRRWKIGITSKFRISVRERQIDRSVKRSKEQIIYRFPLFFYKSVEKFLHRRYSGKRKSFRGSGATEWFKLSIFQKLEVLFILFSLSIVQLIVLCLFIILLLR